MRADHRREFIATMKRELPTPSRSSSTAISLLSTSLRQPSGREWLCFSRYAKVLEADGTPMRVRTALALINQVLDEVLAEQDGEFDADTRWALSWFEQSGFDERPLWLSGNPQQGQKHRRGGDGRGGILAAKAGKVRLLRRDELR